MHEPSPITALDLHLFNEGAHAALYLKLGAHPMMLGGREGVHFAVWAPSAGGVSVVGDFNRWNPEATPLSPRESSGIWEGFVQGVSRGDLYKFAVRSRASGIDAYKSDPLALASECPPRTASRVWDLDYAWTDHDWMSRRSRTPWHEKPVSIYEVHLGSWRRVPEQGDRPLSYREAAHQLAEYVSWLGFTHVELMPVMEHPFDGSWGYQTTGYFCPTARFGTPQDFMYLVDVLHNAGVGVILDWVPSHFATDGHGLGVFDGTHLYEHQDPRAGFHPDWGSYIFNYDRHEVRSFLLSSASIWFDRYHIDALRVDAVASMLYLDYSRKSGEWIPNAHGGNENLPAIRFMQQLNASVYERFPGVATIAEESTAWGGVTRATNHGGLGFGFKWDMGWMHDTLRYLARDPAHRKWHHDELTFRALYANTENYVLPLSHDEVVHGKGSLISRMPGDPWQRFANLRVLLAYQWLLPAKKLLFMGGEFAQLREWSHQTSLDWHLTHDPRHAAIQELVRALNRLYSGEPALHARDTHPEGFRWIACDDRDNSVLAFSRHAPGAPSILAVLNLTPVPRNDYRLGVDDRHWTLALDTDAEDFAGSGYSWQSRALADGPPMHDRPRSIAIALPPLAAVVYVARGG